MSVLRHFGSSVSLAPSHNEVATLEDHEAEEEVQTQASGTSVQSSSSGGQHEAHAGGLEQLCAAVHHFTDQGAHNHGGARHCAARGPECR